MDKELYFESRFSEEEVNKNFKDIDFFSSIMDGLNEAVEYERGSMTSGMVVRKRSIPDINVAAERHALNMTQKKYAAMLGVSSRTVEAWECGRGQPSGATRRLIYLIKNDHNLAKKLISVFGE